MWPLSFASAAAPVGSTPIVLAPYSLKIDNRLPSLQPTSRTNRSLSEPTCFSHRSTSSRFHSGHGRCAAPCSGTCSEKCAFRNLKRLMSGLAGGTKHDVDRICRRIGRISDRNKIVAQGMASEIQNILQSRPAAHLATSNSSFHPQIQFRAPDGAL